MNSLRQFKEVRSRKSNGDPDGIALECGEGNMFRKVTILMVTAAVILICLTSLPSDASAASKTMNIGVRVYRLGNRGSYHFLKGVRVELNDGRARLTGQGTEMPGMASFRILNAPRLYYTARALVNGRWYSETSRDVFGPNNIRINVEVP
jgi:hypothetical protein